MSVPDKILTLRGKLRRMEVIPKHSLKFRKKTPFSETFGGILRPLIESLEGESGAEKLKCGILGGKPKMFEASRH